MPAKTHVLVKCTVLWRLSSGCMVQVAQHNQWVYQDPEGNVRVRLYWLQLLVKQPIPAGIPRRHCVHRPRLLCSQEWSCRSSMTGRFEVGAGGKDMPVVAVLVVGEC